MTFWQSLLSIFGWWKPKPPKPTPPPTPTPVLRPIGIFTEPNATVKLDSVGSGTTNADGYYCWPNVDAALSACHLWITAKDYQPYDHHIDLTPQQVGQDIFVGKQRPDGPHPYDIYLPALTANHVDPSVFSLRELARIRGAMWTVRGPWQYGPRPGQPSNITALEFLFSYGNDPKNLTSEQRAMLDTYKSFKYTHCAFGPPNGQSYHGQFPDHDFTVSPAEFDKWLDWVQLFWDEGLAPVVFIHEDGATFEETKAKYDPLIRGNTRCQKLLRIVVPSGWEPTKYDWSSRTWGLYFDWAHELLPNALILAHSVADVDALAGTDALYDDNGKGNDKAWQYIAPKIHGWLTQSAAFENPDAHSDPNHPNNTNFDNWALNYDRTCEYGYWNRFHNGYAGWPTISLWGNEPIYIYAGEYDSYWEYWMDRPYDEGTKWGDRAIAVGADGYLDSGTVDVPPARG